MKLKYGDQDQELVKLRADAEKRNKFTDDQENELITLRAQLAATAGASKKNTMMI